MRATLRASGAVRRARKSYVRLLLWGAGMTRAAAFVPFVRFGPRAQESYLRGSRRPLLLETQEPGDAEPHQQGPIPAHLPEHDPPQLDHDHKAAGG
jgi:hypothetical protein